MRVSKMSSMPAADTVGRVAQSDLLIVMGDLNARVGVRQISGGGPGEAW